MIKMMRKFMFNVFKKPKKKLQSSSGQVAIIMMVVIAIALIFYAVALNLGRIADTKTQVTMASNMAASQLASSMAGYGQALSAENLKGKIKHCEKTSVIVAIIVFIVAIILTILTWGQPAFILAAIALVVASANLALQVAYVQPMITEMWNKIINETMSTRDQFLEQAIQNALQNAAGDQVRVPDYGDMDQDRVYGFEGGDPVNGKPLDKIGRYEFYYNEKRIKAITQGEIADLQAFLEALEEFVYEGRDGWGLYDPVLNCPEVDRPSGPPIGSGPVPISQCNPCCVPLTVADGSDVIDVRPECCYHPVDNPNPTEICGTAEHCSGLSPYGLENKRPAVGPNYPWVYDPLYEQPGNGFFSLREQFGSDDEHENYFRRGYAIHANTTFSADGPYPSGLGYFHQRPNRHHTPEIAILPPEYQFDIYEDKKIFLLQDVTGYFTEPNFTQTTIPPEVITDPKAGIFDFFYKVSDWGVKLDDVAATPIVDEYDPRCFWCDERNGITCAGFPFHSPENTQLSLPFDPFDADPGLRTFIMDSYCVDGPAHPKPAFAGPPIASDKVFLRPNLFELSDLDAQTDCAQYNLYDLDAADAESFNEGFWRRGNDRYCSTEWPYYSSCSKHNPGNCTDEEGFASDCTCPQVGSSRKVRWHDDTLDSFTYALADFSEYALEILGRASTDLSELAVSFPDWYQDMARWIEPLSPPASDETFPPCYICAEDEDVPEEGGLWVMQKVMQRLERRLNEFRNNDRNRDPEAPPIATGYTGTGCDEVWCVPENEGAGCVGITDAERSTYDVNRNLDIHGRRIVGDMEDIIACLNYNLNGYDFVTGDPLRNCLNDCTQCDPTASLPAANAETGLPYFYPTEPFVIDDDVGHCNTAGQWLYSDTEPESPEWVPGEPIDLDGNEWYAAIVFNLSQAINPDSVDKGNATRLYDCATSCNETFCDANRMPRSLIDTTIYDPGEFTANFDPPPGGTDCTPDVDLMMSCLQTCELDPTLIIPGDPTTPCASMPKFKTCVPGTMCIPYFPNTANLLGPPCADGADCNPLVDFNSALHCGVSYFCPVPDNPTAFCEDPEDFTDADCVLNLFTNDPATEDFSAGGPICQPAPNGNAFVPGTQFKNDLDNLFNNAIVFDPKIVASPFFTTFLGCNSNCAGGDCQNLPHTAADVDPVDPAWGFPYTEWYSVIANQIVNINSLGDPDGHAAQLQTCLDSCSAANCTIMPKGPGGRAWDMSNPWFAAIDFALNNIPNAAGPHPDDRPFLETCKQGCSTARCSVMPQYVKDSCGLAYFYPDPLTITPADCTAQPFEEGNDLYDAIVKSLLVANPQCDLRDDAATFPITDYASIQAYVDNNNHDPSDYSTNGWLLNTWQSAKEAENQLAKFKVRRDFLQNRLNEIDRMVGDISRTTNPQNVVDVSKILTCIVECGDDNCASLPNFIASSIVAGAPEPYPWDPSYPLAAPFFPLNPFDESQDCNGDDLIDFQDFIDPTNNRYWFTGALRALEMAGHEPGILTLAQAQFEEFLLGPAAGLIQSRIELAESETGLPYHAVYGWRGKEITKGADNGQWHVVKVEARLPGKCDDACGVDVETGELNLEDPEWPRIKTSTSGFLGTKRCFTLLNTDGIVKVRVTRYDQDKHENFLSFPNGIPIWDFRFFHPTRGKFDVSELDDFCTDQMIRNYKDPLDAEPDHYKGAFLMNGPVRSTNPIVDNQGCWALVTTLLGKGVVTETCAQYYFHDPSFEDGGKDPNIPSGQKIRGMGFKFIKCPKF